MTRALKYSLLNVDWHIHTSYTVSIGKPFRALLLAEGDACDAPTSWASVFCLVNLRCCYFLVNKKRAGRGSQRNAAVVAGHVTRAAHLFDR